MLRPRRTGAGRRAGRSTSSAPAATGPRPSTSRRWPRSSSPAPGAGSSSTATGPRRPPAAPPTCSRSSGVAIDLPADRGGAHVAEAGIGFCFAPVFHPAMRYAGGAAPRAGRADRVQLPRPADQPGPAARRRRSAAPTRRMAPVMAEVLADAGRLRAGLPRRRRPGRADDDDDVAGLGRATRDGHATRRLDPATARDRASAAPARPARRRRGVHNAPSSGTCSPGEPGRCATRCCSTRLPALAAFDGTDRPGTARCAASGTGDRADSSRSTPARPPTC